MRRLVVGTAALAACSTGYAFAGDLDGNRLRLAAVMAAWWVAAVITIRWVRAAPTGHSPTGHSPTGHSPTGQGLGGRGPGVRPGADAGGEGVAAVQRVASAGRPGRLGARVLVVVFAAALVPQLPGLASPPRSSSDAYRYVWDGRVQLAGTSPYRFAPLDDRLAALRDPVLFPGLGPHDRSGYATEPVPTDRRELLARSSNDPRTRINRPRVPTIYPPVAQAWFAATAWVTPEAWGTRGLQLGSALLASAVAVALAALLRRSGRDPWGALWWAWCPTVLAESGNGAHVDVLAAAFVVMALGAATSHRLGPLSRVLSAGVLTGLAIATKLYPALLLAALFPLRRNTLRALAVAGAAAATVAVVYLPHWLAVRSQVIGYLPGYLLEESGANRSGLLALALPQALLGPASVVVVAVVAALTAWRLGTGGTTPAVGAALVLGTLMLVTTPSYPWYALPLVACAVLAERLEWLVVAAASTAAYASASVHPLPTIGYAASAVVVLAYTVRRRQRLRSGAGRLLVPAAP